ncbi:MAG: ABC transporter permease [Paludibacter sp.]|nr:ABC transporter permease [Bacteroidales bacterium]MCM1068680.1 ABC transporter permease [Prevotella sp.]MCM1353344.1 ABC transporter permease [Bacteroides sp.]MCM1442248.1 ABC transporter permease [Muribaculum sp.]MCM1481067.1 ABC transporter permease [Paludibacter sp.]
MQSKIALIIGREYKTRVCKKSFILLTLLTPLLLVGIVALPILLSQAKSDTQRTVVVIDSSGLYRSVFADTAAFHFIYTEDSLTEARTEYTDVTGFLCITGNLAKPEGNVIYYSDKQANVEMMAYLRSTLGKFVEQQKLDDYNIPDLSQIIRDVQTEVPITTIKWGDNDEEKQGSAELAEVVGMLSAFLIYMFIVLYGAQVMSGVVQEKSNRIMEVMVSSVRPFQLMMGKIIGIALVGLTQFFLWVVLLTFCFGVVLPMVSSGADSAMAAGSDTIELLKALQAVDVPSLLVLFVVYFLCGYLLYASFFAAFGSAVDNETDTQQFSLILTIPIVFAMYAAIYSAQNPDGPLAFWCSMIPFTSPIVMLVRLPFDVAWWEIGLSIFILIVSFVGSTWLAGKIYRTGILMYGKKPSWAELWKWLRY